MKEWNIWKPIIELYKTLIPPPTVLLLVQNLHRTLTNGRMTKYDSPIWPFSEADTGQMEEHSPKWPWPENQQNSNSPICRLPLFPLTFDGLTALRYGIIVTEIQHLSWRELLSVRHLSLSIIIVAVWSMDHERSTHRWRKTLHPLGEGEGRVAERQMGHPRTADDAGPPPPPPQGETISMREGEREGGGWGCGDVAGSCRWQGASSF